ncbi:TPA: aldehyde dehydrogenase family protein [Burkholderia vietnamiensis]|uniref:aldehyde dehydrogenase family protein n=1 Tax=Burkholderia vietnamiensis TaxID=60552 RepID=UPI00158BB8EF|nr:aldehyde dehydrogenase family protein [Burkholderia vietnamiensis]MBR7913566.1 aldehyde dehydrogenase family protein [Burkholderia vietnamiensis]HDR8920538.1 aldehyde dehydrogenase family protein [Burkholderia vietnamiensis]HDR8996519.1 aldehyde dehydrogenase family protein [Burkholderia vietnamiensis]HDR9069661.1 aldehyde dehydrogenase family protein [Burkholderia vietnamiensis]HDR9277563.1 aldehyde dehydrogenase family protein [Burkholderia vietnamiensis]
MNARHWIAGEWTGMPNIDSIDPATGEAVGQFADGGAIEADAAIAAARHVFDHTAWAQDARLRQDVLLGWASALEAERDMLATLLTRENGKAIAQSRGEIAGAISEVRYYAGLARHIAGHVLEPEPGTISTMLREAAGVAAIIVPWNAPAVLLVRSLAPALAAGCTAIVKPAAQTSLLTAAMLRCFERTALPEGAVNLVNERGHAASQRLVDSHDVDVVSFTGSTATGKKIMAAAADSMKKLSLELGGKSCCVVFDDADIAVIAPRLARAATIISGQQCTAARRVLVHASRAAEMRKHLASALASLSVGPGVDPATDIGALIDGTTRDAMQQTIERACGMAERVLLQGTCSGHAFLSPTLVEHGDPKAFFCQDEIFGPFVTLEVFENEMEAIDKANDTVFGLSASAWAHDGARAFRVARALRNGTVWINDHNKLFAEAETGGYRQSGLGRLHGYDALADFTELKHICMPAGVAERSAPLR